MITVVCRKCEISLTVIFTRLSFFDVHSTHPLVFFLISLKVKDEEVDEQGEFVNELKDIHTRKMMAQLKLEHFHQQKGKTG